jgi:HemY protein
VKLIIISLLTLVVVVTAGVYFSNEQGQVVLMFADYTVQASMGFLVLTAVVSFIIFYIIVRLVFGLIDLPENYRRWKKTRRHSRSEYYLTQGFLAMTEGNWRAAEKFFNKGAPYSRLPIVNYLGAARAAQQLGAVDQRDYYLRLAYAEEADSYYAVGVTRAELQISQHQTEEAYATLKHLDAEKPGKGQVKLMMLDASTELKDWEQTLILLNELGQQGLMPVEKIKARQLQAYANLLTTAGKTGNVADLNETWKRIPKSLKSELYLIEVYISARLAYPDTTDCEPLLKQVIKHNPDPALVRLYGLVESSHPEKQLAFVEKLLEQRAGDPVLLLTAGRLYKRAQFWGKAKASLEQSLVLEPTAEACYELAIMYENKGDKETASSYYRKGLTLSAAPVAQMTNTLIAGTSVKTEAVQ